MQFYESSDMITVNLGCGVIVRVTFFHALSELIVGDLGFVLSPQFHILHMSNTACATIKLHAFLVSITPI